MKFKYKQSDGELVAAGMEVGPIGQDERVLVLSRKIPAPLRHWKVFGNDVVEKSAGEKISADNRNKEKPNAIKNATTIDELRDAFVDYLGL